MSEPLQVLPTFARLSECVYVVLALNPGKFTLQGTNTYLVGTGLRRILIDTGSGVSGYAELLRESLSKAGATGISRIICTHRHQDHISGIPQVFAVNGTETPVHKRLTSRDTSPLPFPYENIEDRQVFETEGATLHAIYTPGHLDDHVALHLEEENSVFAGDCILGQGTAVFENLSQYMSSLKRIRDLKLARIYPGHGPVVEDGLNRVDSYIAHRQEREDQIMALLRTDPENPESSNATQWSSSQLVRVMYSAYPESMYDAAEGSVINHLEKLLAEGKVRQIDNKWRLSIY